MEKKPVCRWCLGFIEKERGAWIHRDYGAAKCFDPLGNRRNAAPTSESAHEGQPV